MGDEKAVQTATAENHDAVLERASDEDQQNSTAIEASSTGSDVLDEKHPDGSTGVAAEALQENPADEEAQANYPKGFKLVALIFALCIAIFLVALDQTIIATAIPKITDRFNSIGDIGWYGSAYFLTSTALQPSFGRIYKVFSVREPRICTLHAIASNERLTGKNGLPHRNRHI